jgi:hypothetical protein
MPKPPKYPWATIPLGGSFLLDKDVARANAHSMVSRAGRKYGRVFTCTATPHGTIVTRVEERPPRKPPPPQPRKSRRPLPDHAPRRIAEYLVLKYGPDFAWRLATELTSLMVKAETALGAPVRRIQVFPLRPENIVPTNELSPKPVPVDPVKREPVAEDWFPPGFGREKGEP